MILLTKKHFILLFTFCITLSILITLYLSEYKLTVDILRIFSSVLSVILSNLII